MNFTHTMLSERSQKQKEADAVQFHFLNSQIHTTKKGKKELFGVMKMFCLQNGVGNTNACIF